MCRKIQTSVSGMSMVTSTKNALANFKALLPDSSELVPVADITMGNAIIQKDLEGL